MSICPEKYCFLWYEGKCGEAYPLIIAMIVFVNHGVNPMHKIGMNLANQNFVGTDYQTITLFAHITKGKF